MKAPCCPGLHRAVLATIELVKGQPKGLSLLRGAGEAQGGAPSGEGHASHTLLSRTVARVGT
jgi:hypothetical protein